ncbi:prostaglandin E2 receptor EP3 subtype isoform X2 [Rhodnius prolixus]|uniref:prostaglandin E2 receptor EP3 subtype isoform X2 n=1 Tax=Rhodnius prolixus TaxID=13249 RepID=UPI003D18D572
MAYNSSEGNVTQLFDLVLNSSVHLVNSSAGSVGSPASGGSIHRDVLITMLYLLGFLGNATALALLFGSKSAPRNPRLSLMLRCLAVNDLTAVLGMWILMNLKSYIAGLAKQHWLCSVRVIWRSFGLGSGCIVCIMAIDRWIALSIPFFYHRHVTLGTIRKGIVSLWLVDLLIVCLPFFGFGSYYDRTRAACIRYKFAEHPADRAYAYLYLSFGLLLCACLVTCNLAVMRVLLSPVNLQRKSHVLVRRISRNRDLTYNASTSEELAFAKVMGLLCLVFVICWLPQLFTVPIAQMYPRSPRCHFYVNLADGILALHFVVDPYLYVLQRWACFRNLCRSRPSSRDILVLECSPSNLQPKVGDEAIHRY